MTNRRRLRGLTLLELLLAMSAGMVVLLATAHLLGEAGEKCGRASGGAAVRREFRFAMEQWEADFSNAVGEPEAKLPEPDPEGWSTRIDFFLLQPASKQAEEQAVGDLCGVTYYVKDLETRGGVVRCLMRGLRSSAETFEALKAGTVETLFEPRDFDEPVAFGVVRFGIRSAAVDDKGGVSQTFQWRVEIARRELANQLDDPAAWEAVAMRPTAAQQRQIEGRTGTATLGHESER